MGWNHQLEYDALFFVKQMFLGGASRHVRGSGRFCEGMV